MFSSRSARALGVVGLDQRGVGLPLQNEIELPDEVFRVLHAGIGAACAERRDLMRAVAAKDHPAMHEPVDAPALEGIERDPFQLEIAVTQHALDARDDVFRLLLDLGIRLRPQLQVDAPDVVRLLVQQGRLPRMERRVEPEPALGRKIGRHLHVRDQEAVVEDLAAEFQPQHVAQGGFRAVAGDQPVRVDLVGALRRLDGQPDALGLAVDRGHLVAPAQVDARQFRDPLHQIELGVILLQVDEGRHLVAVLGQEVELVHEVVLQKVLADLPGDALVHHRPGDAEAVPDLQRALGKADGARALADAVGVVEDYHLVAAHGQIDGDRHAHRPGAHDDDPVTGRGTGCGECVLID